MRSVFFVVIVVACSSLLLAQKENNRYERDLEELRARHHADIEKAMEPLRKRYTYNLETLLKRATTDNDLETALKIKKEMDTIQQGKTSAFVGEWEYREDGVTYRRILTKDGRVELWKEGREWMRSANVPIWDGHRWRTVDDTVEFMTKEGRKTFVLKLIDKDTVSQKDMKNGKISTFKRGAKSWK